jgi:hypothetical protein
MTCSATPYAISSFGLETNARTDSLAKVRKESCASLEWENCVMKMKRGINRGIAKIENSTEALPLLSMKIFFIRAETFLN